MRDRAFRRFQEFKKKKWVQKVLAKRPTQRPFKLTKTDIGVYAHTPAICSCVMCGNPRKWFNEPTIHEKRMQDYYKATDDDYE